MAMMSEDYPQSVSPAYTLVTGLGGIIQHVSERNDASPASHVYFTKILCQINFHSASSGHD